MKDKRIDDTTAIDLWYSKRSDSEKKGRKTGWVQFLAVSGEVSAAINAGYTKRLIHEYLIENGKLKCSYDTFRLYVKKFLDQSSQKQPSPAPVAVASASNKDVAEGEQHQPPQKLTPPKSFKYEPKPDTDKLY